MTDPLDTFPSTLRGRLDIVVLVAVSLVGCAGQVDSVAMHLKPLAQTAPSTAPAGDLTVAVETFNDAPVKQLHLGSRSHLWGGTTYFDLVDGKPGEVVARVVADYLRKQGWRVKNADAGGSAAMTISGTVRELSVDATSSFGSTDIRAATKTTVEAVNAADGSKVRITLTGVGAQGVFWFDSDDAQALLSETFTESLRELIANTKVENKKLRLK